MPAKANNTGDGKRVKGKKRLSGKG